jgi:hypothetical protein
MLWRIFGNKGDDVTGMWWKLHNEDLHNLHVCIMSSTYYSYIIIIIITTTTSPSQSFYYTTSSQLSGVMSGGKVTDNPKSWLKQTKSKHGTK